MTPLDRELYYLLDPVARVNQVFGLGFQLDDLQARIIVSQATRMQVCCTRQWGKTTTVAAKAATEALAGPGLILVIAPVERQARECFRKIRDCLKRAMPKARWPEDNKTSLELPNGARVVALPAQGDNVRGYTNPRLIIIDEAAFVGDEDYRAIRPMLSHGARLIVMSTPFGRRGWFWEAWDRQDPAWERISVVAAECPHISEEFLQEERIALGDWWYRQEYQCQFLDSVDAFFNMDSVRDGLDEGIEPLFAQRNSDGSYSYEEEEITPLFQEAMG